MGLIRVIKPYWSPVFASSGSRWEPATARDLGLRHPGHGRPLWAGLCETGLNADRQQVGGHSLLSEQSQQIRARCLEHPKYLIFIRVLCAGTKAHLAWGVCCSGANEGN